MQACQHSCRGSSSSAPALASSPFLSCAAGRPVPSPISCSFCSLNFMHSTWTWLAISHLPGDCCGCQQLLLSPGCPAWVLCPGRWHHCDVISPGFSLPSLAEQPQSCCFMAGRLHHLKPEAGCMEPDLQTPYQLQIRLRFLQEAVVIV